MIISIIKPAVLRNRVYLEVDTDSEHLALLSTLEEMIKTRKSPRHISRTYNKYMDGLDKEELLVFTLDVQQYLDDRGAFTRKRSPKEQRIYEALNEAKRRERSMEASS